MPKREPRTDDNCPFGERQAQRILARVSRLRGIQVGFADIENPFWTAAHQGEAQAAAAGHAAPCGGA